MTPLLRKIFFLFLFPLPFMGISQIAVEHWQDHLPYNKAIDIANEIKSSALLVSKE